MISIAFILISHADRVQRLMGYGSFGSVVRAEDVLTGGVVAVKVLHRVRGLHRHLEHEARMYETLLLGCSPRISLFAEVLGFGDHCGFQCIVFEFCEITLYDVLQEQSGLVPLPARHVREIAYQVLLGVEYLHSLGFIHGDVKPNNIAFKRFEIAPMQVLNSSGEFYDKNVLASTALCIIDLGSTMTRAELESSPAVLGAILYRAPEVSLGMPLSFGVDIFAIGCVIAEVHAGTALFHPGIASELEHLAMVDRTVGPFPLEFARAIEQAKAGTFRFTPKMEVIYPPSGKYPKSAFIASVRRLQDTKHICMRIHNNVLVDLLKKLLWPDPSQRLCLATALRHPYFDSIAMASDAVI
ncbi:kinase-like domain-containing protein [Lenzites betulinus]|nr:kinase-like domain-containing protein [Lenzites betulinus]